MSRRFAFALAIVVGFGNLALGSLSLASDYYVSEEGSDVNPGTFDQPFLTINKAAGVAEAGDTVHVRGGVYNERVVPANSGLSGNYITFQNYGTEEPIVDATGLDQGFILYGVSYIRINGFKVINSKRSGIHIHDHKDAADYGSDRNVIENNVVRDCGTDGYNGIYIGGNGNTVQNNEISRCGSDNGSPSGHGIYILGSNNTVRGNNVHDNARLGVRMEGNGNLVEENTLHGNGEYGLGIWVDAPLQATGISIQKNLIHDNTKGGIRIWGEGSGEKPDTVYVYNNTIVNSTARDGIYASGGAKNINLKNNIIMGDFTNVILGAEESTEGYEEDYNLVYGSGWFVYGSGYYGSLQDYQLASSEGGHTLFGDPELQEDYTLSQGSIAVDHGTYVGLPYNGVAPDMGAFESDWTAGEETENPSDSNGKKFGWGRKK